MRLFAKQSKACTIGMLCAYITDPNSCCQSELVASGGAVCCTNCGTSCLQGLSAPRTISRLMVRETALDTLGDARSESVVEQLASFLVDDFKMNPFAARRKG